MGEVTFRPLANPGQLWGTSAESRSVLESNYRRVAPDILRLFLANRTPITLWGPVGSRKTRTIEALSVERDERDNPYQVITIQPSTEDPTIIHGIMYTAPEEGTGEIVMKRSVPDVAQQVQRYYDNTGGLTVLFLDEMTTCMPAQQHALLGILTHGRYGEIDISPYITIAMAANPEGTVSIVNPLGEQVINRGGHIPWYGDLNLFLEEWRTGFGNDDRAPSSDVNWYISTLLDQSPNTAFRSEDGNWKPDQLVPYDLMEHTERAVTELGKMIELVNEVFDESKDEVRHFYIAEIATALLGREWGNRMKTVTQMENQRISADVVVQRVIDYEVQEDWNLDRLRNVLGSSLYEAPSGATMRQDQVTSVAHDMYALIERGNVFHRDPYIALWALAMTAPSENVKMSMHEHLVKLLFLAQKQVQVGGLDKSSAIPNFVNEETRNALRVAAQR